MNKTYAFILIGLVSSLFLALTLRVRALSIEESDQSPAGSNYFYLEDEFSFPSSISANDWELHPDGKTIYVAAHQGLFAVDMMSQTVIHIAPSISRASIMSLNSDGSKLYAGDYSVEGAPLNITVIDLFTLDVLHHYSFTHTVSTQIDGLVASDDGRIFYTLGRDLAQDNKLYVMDEESGAIINTLPLTSSPPIPGEPYYVSYELVLSPQMGRLFALQSYAGPNSPGDDRRGVRINIAEEIPFIENTVIGYSWQNARMTNDESIIYRRGSGSLLGYSAESLLFDHQLAAFAPNSYDSWEISQDDKIIAGFSSFVSELTVDIFDLENRRFIGSFFDDDSLRAETAFPLPNNRIAILYRDELRIYAQGYQASLPVLFNDYCTVGHYDDFSDRTSGWPIFWQNGFYADYHNGEYGMEHQFPNTWFAVTAAHVWNGGLIEVDGQNRSGNGLWGVALGIDPNWNHMITVEIYPQARWLLVQEYTSNDGWAVLHSAETAAIHVDQGVFNRLEIRSNEDIEINDISTRVRLPNRLDGRVAFTSAGFSIGAQQRFDDYQFVRQQCPQPPDTEGGERVPDAVRLSRPWVIPNLPDGGMDGR